MTKTHPRAMALVLAVALAAACDGAATGPSASLLGEWSGPTESWSSPVGPSRMTRTLTFAPGGGYQFETIVYGAAGQPTDRVSAWTRTIGEYRLCEGGRLELRIARVETWDGFAREESAAKVYPELDPYWQEHGRVTLDGDRMRWTYTTHTADEGQEVTMEYQRIH